MNSEEYGIGSLLAGIMLAVMFAACTYHWMVM